MNCSEREREYADHLDKIHALETKQALTPPMPNNWRHCDLVSLCLDRKVKDKHSYFAHHFYEQGNKCGRLLARQLKKQQDSHHVHSLFVQADIQSIAAEFHRFFESLYNIPPSFSKDTNGHQVDKIQAYLRDSALPALPFSVLEKL